MGGFSDVNYVETFVVVIYVEIYVVMIYEKIYVVMIYVEILWLDGNNYSAKYPENEFIIHIRVFLTFQQRNIKLHTSLKMLQMTQIH